MLLLDILNRISLIFQYEFNWNVQDPEAEKDGLFFEQTESKSEDTPDRTEGEYKVGELKILHLLFI